LGTEKGLFEGEFNSNAFKALFDTYFTQVRNFVYYKTSDSGVAEDITQEAFVKVWENRSKVNPETAKSYLYTIAGNLSINHLKKQNVIYRFLNTKFNTTEKETPLYILEEKEFDERLQHALSALPEKQRVVFLMNRIDDLKYTEIADRLGLSIKAVEKRMSNALKTLKETISQKV
jgi:RNA polymerase sigma-70 factor (ECF subfamily)